MSSQTNPVMPPSVATYTGPVFHYTSSAGLLGSLESRAIRASAAASLNDLGEVRQGWDLIKEILAALPDSEHVEMLKQFANDPLKGQHEVFILSASTNGDDANQWRLYADGGRGYVIELDGAVPLAAVSEIPDAKAPAAKSAMGNLAKNLAAVSPWHRVLYSASEVESALKELVAAVDHESARIEVTSGMPEDAVSAAYETLQVDAYEALSMVAHLIKSPGFVGENEVRVVATFMWGDEHIKYRPATHGIIAYATLAEAPGGPRLTVLRPKPPATRVVTDLPIKSVRLGPLLLPEHKNTMKAFLRGLNLKAVDITASTVPLR